MTTEALSILSGRARARVLAVGLALVTAVASAQPGSGRVFERFDTDGNEIIEPREREAARRATFDRADADNDDYVTGPEIAALRDDLTQDYGRGGRLGSRASEGAGQTTADRIKALDTDGDGRIAEAEFVSGIDPLLQRFDGNEDGSITRAEMEEGAAQVREDFRRRRGAR